jgi:hypothetical protein
MTSLEHRGVQSGSECRPESSLEPDMGSSCPLGRWRDMSRKATVRDEHACGSVSSRSRSRFAPANELDAALQRQTGRVRPGQDAIRLCRSGQTAPRQQHYTDALEHLCLRPRRQPALSQRTKPNVNPWHLSNLSNASNPPNPSNPSNLPNVSNPSPPQPPASPARAR